ncbi:hypothetical protein RJT34_07834 [Clitoria ternatea]|uniref:Uncharacterized protein n=1 Tax=Clitoria ternatea TaxID=43366 RepID=A0AAN9K3R2_CLITE
MQTQKIPFVLFAFYISLKGDLCFISCLTLVFVNRLLCALNHIFAVYTIQIDRHTQHKRVFKREKIKL